MFRFMEVIGQIVIGAAVLCVMFFCVMIVFGQLGLGWIG